MQVIFSLRLPAQLPVYCRRAYKNCSHVSVWAVFSVAKILLKSYPDTPSNWLLFFPSYPLIWLSYSFMDLWITDYFVFFPNKTSSEIFWGMLKPRNVRHTVFNCTSKIVLAVWKDILLHICSGPNLSEALQLRDVQSGILYSCFIASLDSSGETCGPVELELLCLGGCDDFGWSFADTPHQHSPAWS